MVVVERSYRLAAGGMEASAGLGISKKSAENRRTPSAANIQLEQPSTPLFVDYDTGVIYYPIHWGFLQSIVGNPFLTSQYC